MTRARRCRSSLAAVVGASQLIRGVVCCAGRMESGGRVRRSGRPLASPSGDRPGAARRRIREDGVRGARSAPWSRVGPSRHPRGIVRARHVGASGRKGSGARSAPWSRAGSSRHPRGIVRARHVGASGRKGSGARSAPWSRVGSSRHPWGWSGRGGLAHLGWAGGRPFDRLEHGPGSDLCRNPPGRRPGEARRGGLAQGRTWHVIGAALSGSRRAHDRILRQG
jgi:hypothetical protein